MATWPNAVLAPPTVGSVAGGTNARGGLISDPLPAAPALSYAAQSEAEHFRCVHDFLVGKEFWVTIEASKFYWDFYTDYVAFYISADELGIPSLVNHCHVTIVYGPELRLGGLEVHRQLRR